MIGPEVDGTDSRLFGVYPAEVADLEDPLGIGRVQVHLPWLGEAGAGASLWATLLSPYADDDQGFQMMPEVGSMVVVAFEAGDPHRGYVLGAAWNGTRALPRAASNANDVRSIRTRSGSRIEFDDTLGTPTVSIAVAGDASGAVHKIVLDDAADTVTVRSKSGAEVTLTAGGGILVKGVTPITVQAPMVTVDTPMANFSGVVQCQTLIASTVVSAMYTPGVGNIW